MEHERFIIKFDGQEHRDIYDALVAFDIEMDEELAGMFRLSLSITKQPDGTWTFLDDDRLVLWQNVSISAGFSKGTEEVMSGYITHVRPLFSSEQSQCILEIWGMDGSVLMDREEKLKDWPNKKDSDIASEIFSSYKFSPIVDDTAVIHDEAISTIIQRETDMQFLKRLALRNGYVCYVEGVKGYFRKPNFEEKPFPVLAVHFGDETNVSALSFEVNTLRPTNVSMLQIDRTNKQVLEAAAENSQHKSLGKKKPSDFLPSQVNSGHLYMSMNAATGNPEMTTICQELYHQGQWFVTAEGELSGNIYGRVLKPGRTVTIKGVGKTYSGVYYITYVNHSFTHNGYRQYFRIKRNAVMLTGSENFSISS